MASLKSFGSVVCSLRKVLFIHFYVPGYPYWQNFGQMNLNLGQRQLNQGFRSNRAMCQKCVNICKHTDPNFLACMYFCKLANSVSIC